MGFLNRLWRRHPPLSPDPVRIEPALVDLQKVRAHFNEAARDEEHFPSTIDPRIQHVQVILNELVGLNPNRVADVGCGKGRFARIVKERYPTASVVAVDLAEAMLLHAPTDLQRVAASMTELPLADASVDAAYATESLEHAQDIELAVAELVRIVRPGGKIVIIDKNAVAWGRLETSTWERWFGAKELETMLRKRCKQVSSREISYWDDVAPDGLFLVWIATK
jgi:malonyl-CoA O-methyltransferase